MTDSTSQPPADQPKSTPLPPPPDDGLRRLLTWTFIALAITLLLAALGATLAVYWFDPGA